MRWPGIVAGLAEATGFAPAALERWTAARLGLLGPAAIRAEVAAFEHDVFARSAEPDPRMPYARTIAVPGASDRPDLGVNPRTVADGRPNYDRARARGSDPRGPEVCPRSGPSSVPLGLAGGLGSLLNADGTPLELAFTLRPGRRPVARLISDPGAFAAHPAERKTIALGVARALAELHPALERPIAALLEHTVLPVPAERLARGVLWCAERPGAAGLALYVSAAPFGGDWAIAERVARTLLPAMDAFRAALSALSAETRVSSLAIEGDAAENLRFKVYFRQRGPTPLPFSRDEAPLQGPLLEFLSVLLGDLEIRLEGLVSAIGFSLQSGALIDRKVDVCCCRNCLGKSNALTDELIALAPHFGFDLSAVSGLTTPLRPAFVGLGRNLAGESRLNLYLQELPVKDPL